MAGINRIGSPMDLCDEGLDEAPEQVEKRKRELTAKQTSKSPFFIGSIEDVNQKIGKLERRLQNHTQLVVESRASEQEYLPEFAPSSARSNYSYHQREKEKKDIQRFAGFFAFKSTFFPKVSTRVKNISKISKETGKETTVHLKKEKDAGKPKFAELHQFPGYDPNKLTPLPGHLTSEEILNVVVQASVRIDKMHSYRPEFQRLLFSTASQAILQDTFWYFFLEKFQKSPTEQQNLFNRVAHNYVSLLFDANNPYFRDTFLKQYPTLISQAVYATFCHCFPDSYTQFGEKFKDEIVFLVFSWITGIHPPPRCWMEWNFEKLEPRNIRTKAEIMNRSKKKTLNFDYLDFLTSPNNSQVPTMSMKSSASSSNSFSPKQVRFGHKNRGKHEAIFQKEADKEAHEQRICDKSVAENSITTSDGQVKQITRDDDKEDAPSSTAKLNEEWGEDVKKSHALSSAFLALKEKPDYMMSHPACKGPDFVKASLNLNGKSPLVAHFLQLHNITAPFNLVIHIPHREIENLPPLNAPTYKDIIHQSSKVIRTIEQKFQEMYARKQHERAEIMKEHQAVLREYKKREASLLSNSLQVKCLTDLIVLEQKKGSDPISAGAHQAIKAALMGE
ncbi:protein FAM227B-like isoform X2 [Pomacea canaliculata]|uniref:protein FAM227B-like isoform X2 n=1 Tax=Pomacea canaliculata TaxID=400727 RepID=UPI000D726BE2|nr:protein FAM227B-like isoform X2 [Pomacea canaliculata]